jgi:hypothetical protein
VVFVERPALSASEATQEIPAAISHGIGMLLPHLALGPGSRAGFSASLDVDHLGPRLPGMTTESRLGHASNNSVGHVIIPVPRKVQVLDPRIAARVKCLGEVVASTANDAKAELLLRFAYPPACFRKAIFAS